MRTRDLVRSGIARTYLKQAVDRGQIERVGRGLYLMPDANVTARQSLVEACILMPHAVVCLLSALEFHGLTTQIPSEVWMAIDVKAWKPVLKYPPVRIVRFSGEALTEGVEEHRISGVTVRITNPAKTVVDCFKYRNKIGMDVAMEALRDCWHKRKATMDDLWKHAKICRVSRVMHPYMESLA
mgnify:CR=1 FL=1